MGLTDLFKTYSKTVSSNVANSYLPKSLVFASDFSEASRKAMRHAVELFMPSLENITLVNVYSIPSISIGSLVTVKDILFQLSEEGLDNEEAELKRILVNKSIEINKVSNTGKLTHVLQDICAQKNNPIVCLGTTGVSEVNGVHHGQTAINISNNLSNVPVFTVPKNVQDDRPNNLLYISDIEELNCVGKLDPLIGCAKLYNAKVHVAHISERNILKPSHISAADRDLIPIYQDLYPEVAFTYRNLNGVETIEEQINKLIEQNQIDMLYVVLKEDGFLSELFNEKSSHSKTYFNQTPTISLRV